MRCRARSRRWLSTGTSGPSPWSGSRSSRRTRLSMGSSTRGPGRRCWPAPAPQRETLYVDGRLLHDPHGKPVILRGINLPLLDDWDFPGGDKLADLAQTGANAVRIQWYIHYGDGRRPGLYPRGPGCLPGEVQGKPHHPDLGPVGRDLRRRSGRTERAVGSLVDLGRRGRGAEQTQAVPHHQPGQRAGRLPLVGRTAGGAQRLQGGV